MITNIKTNLLEEYPDLLKQCRAWDCCFSVAIERIEALKEAGSLERFL